MRKERGSCVEHSPLKKFGSIFDTEEIYAQIPSNIQPNYQIAKVMPLSLSRNNRSGPSLHGIPPLSRKSLSRSEHAGLSLL
jgi:hypothetical protein